MGTLSTREGAAKEPQFRAHARADAGHPLMAPLALLARPAVAGVVALVVYLARASLSRTGLARTPYPFFNYLADAWLHGQLGLRLLPPSTHDLITYGGHLYLYWPPFPAAVVLPLVALVGVGVSDVVYTAVLGAVSVALLAQFLAVLDRTGLAPLSVERRAILVTSLAFGSVLMILAPVGRVWFTAQIIGWGCILLAALAAFTQPGRRAYLLTGLALACATATRLGLIVNGLWLAYYLLRRDRDQPLGQRAVAMAYGAAPVVGMVLLMGLYNTARFGSPLEMGLVWHQMDEAFRAEFEQFGAFNLHYLPTNVYYQLVAHPFLDLERWPYGGGIFWMTPILCGALVGIWRRRGDPFVWSLVASVVLLYIPIGLLMGTGWVTFGPRYLLDLMVPLVILTAIGIRRWSLHVLLILLVIGCATYAVGSYLWLVADYLWQV